MTASVPLGRETELAHLGATLHQVRDSGVAVVLVTGPRGVGRSTLLTAVAEQHTGPVCRAVGAPWEAHRAGAVLAQLAGPPSLPPDPLDAAAELRTRLSDPQAVTLLVVDDAHHADLHSLHVLATLRRHHPDAPICVLLSAPSGPGHGSSPDVLELLAGMPDRRVVLEPLGGAALVRLASARGLTVAPWVVEPLHRHTGGLPGAAVALFEEFPRDTWSEPHPELPAPAVVAARVGDRLSRLDPDARRLVEAACVLEDERSLAVAARLAGIEDVWPAVDSGTRAGLLTLRGPAGGHEVGPPDPMVAAAVRASLGAASTRELHARAARLVADPASALRHRVAASPLPDAALADELAALADARASQGAWAEAARLLTDASRFTEDRLLREARLTRAVDALVGAGDGPGAAALVPEVESLRETPLRNAVLGYLAILRGRGAEAEARLGRAWDLVNAERDPGVAALICQRYVLHALARCSWDELVSWADRAVALVGPDDPAGVESAAIRGLGLVAAGRLPEARAAYVQLAGRVRHGAQAQRITLGAGWLHLAVDEVDDARSELQSSVPTSHLGGSARISLWARAWLARTQFLTGEWDEALSTVGAAREPLEASGIVLARPLLDWTAVQIHALRGDLDAAQKALHDAESAPQDYDIMRIPTLLARAALAEAQADNVGVIRALTPLTTATMAEAAAEPGFWPWVDVLATALVGEGRYDEADRLLRPHETRAAAQQRRSASARLGRARGRLLAAIGDLAGARAAFEGSLAALGGLPLPFESARTAFAYGQVLRRAGKRREADALISAARDHYVGLDALTYVARCDRELKAGGVHLARGDRAPAELTPQERAVGDLVARGMSNREVAAELFLSTKTVQYHLTRIYGKLGVRSRTELAAQWAHESGADRT